MLEWWNICLKSNFSALCAILLSKYLLRDMNSMQTHLYRNWSEVLCKQAWLGWQDVVQSFNHVWLFSTSWTAACQVSLSFTISRSLLKLMSIESVKPSNHLILCHPLLLLTSIFPSIRVFSNESVLCIRWPKYWSFSFNISPSMNIQDWSPLGWTGWSPLQSKRLSRVFSNTTVQKHQVWQRQISYDW